jgi:peptidoglycan/xylan/chitin deacetylase (PgdA/CDA1 family)
MTAASRLGYAAGTAAVAAGAYWRYLSPYSQSLSAFPYRASVNWPRDSRLVALTFDDGPNEPYTSEIAGYLNQRGINATFFQVGLCVQRYPATSRALLASGHVIGNHSYSHHFGRCWRERDLVDEIGLAQWVFERMLDYRPALYRPPWLARTATTFEVLASYGLRAVSGEFCHALEPLQPPPDRIARRALAKARPGSIIIFHDGYDAKGANRSSTVAAVKIVVDTLISQGYGFTTVDQLLAIDSCIPVGQPE